MRQDPLNKKPYDCIHFWRYELRPQVYYFARVMSCPSLFPSQPIEPNDQPLSLKQNITTNNAVCHAPATIVCSPSLALAAPAPEEMEQDAAASVVQEMESLGVMNRSTMD